MNNKKQSTEQYESTEENLVQDLKKSLEDTINETKSTLDDLEQTVETTINDQSVSDATKKMVDSIKGDIMNSSGENGKEIINTIGTKKAIKNYEEE